MIKDVLRKVLKCQYRYYKILINFVARSEIEKAYNEGYQNSAKYYNPTPQKGTEK